MKIPILKCHPDAVIPQIQSEGAACVDLVATEVIVKGFYAEVRFGIKTAIPKGWCITLQPRSSFTNKGWVMANSPGIIDSDYRGEWLVKFDNTQAGVPFPYKKGERIVQARLELVYPLNFQEVKGLDSTVRGEGNFGSTDKKE